MTENQTAEAELAKTNETQTTPNSDDKEDETEYPWERYAVEEFKLKGGTTNALNFYFEKGRVSIYKLKKKWTFATFKRTEHESIIEGIGREKFVDYKVISMKKFDIILPEITARKETEFKAMLNTAGFSNRNAGEILGNMSEKMVEHLAEIDIEPTYYEEAMEFFTRVENPSWFKALQLMRTGLYIPDPVPYVMGLTTFISNKIEDSEPIWMFIIGPPGIGKTEFSKYLVPGDVYFNTWVYQLSEFTSKTLISGKEDAEDLVTQIHKKLVLFSDFTVMISSKPEEVIEIFKQLREMYDGEYTKAFGSGVGVKHYKTRFSILAGVTNKIDMYKNLLAALGERFFSVRFKPSTTEFSEEIVKAAFHNQKISPENIKAIQSEMLSLYEKFDPHHLPPIGKEWEQYIMECAMITANLRIPIERDVYMKGRPIVLTPIKEEATRIVKVYKKMAQVLCYVLEKPKFDLEVLSYIYRVTLDSPEALRLDVLRNVKFMAHNLDYICESCDLPRPIILKVLEELKYAMLVNMEQEETTSSNQEGTGTETTKGEMQYFLRKDSPVLGYIRDVEVALGALPEDQIHHNGMGISGLDILKGMTDFNFSASGEYIVKSVEDQIRADEDLPGEEEISFNVEAAIEMWNEGHTEEHLDPNQEIELLEMEVHGFSKEEIEAKLKEMDDNSQHL